VRVEEDFGGHVGAEGVEAAGGERRRLLELETAHLDDRERPNVILTHQRGRAHVFFRVTRVDVEHFVILGPGAKNRLSTRLSKNLIGLLVTNKIRAKKKNDLITANNKFRARSAC
jgi:hypothetical protein